MAVGSLDNETVNLVPGPLKMNQAVDMSIFRITDWKLGENKLNKEIQGIRMATVMKRKITSEMMTTYFPTLLLTAITFATTFFKPFFFEAALSVNLTTMLVMTTIFISKMEGLPPTSDIKMIDIWLVLCQMVPFAEVVLLTAMEYQRDDHLDDEISKSKVISVTAAKTDDEVETGLSKKRKCREACRLFLPQLKTLGLFALIFRNTARFVNAVPCHISLLQIFSSFSFSVQLLLILFCSLPQIFPSIFRLPS